MWNLPEPRKFDKDVSRLASLPYKWRDSRGRQAVNSRATRATILKMPLVNAFITGLWRLLMISRSPEASHEEECSEHEAEHDRNRAAISPSTPARSRALPKLVVARLHRGR